MLIFSENKIQLYNQMDNRFIKVHKKNSNQMYPAYQQNTTQPSSTANKVQQLNNSIRSNKQVNHHNGQQGSDSKPKLQEKNPIAKDQYHGESKSKSNSNLSRPRNEDSFDYGDRIEQLHERLKNAHHFFKLRINEEKNRTSDRNQVFMRIIEEMQKVHDHKVMELKKMIAETENDKKDVCFLDEQMNDRKGSIDEIIRQSTSLKTQNETLQNNINKKAHILREKQQQQETMKQQLMEARNQLQTFQRLNLKQSKRRKQVKGMLQRAKEAAIQQ